MMNARLVLFLQHCLLIGCVVSGLEQSIKRLVTFNTGLTADIRNYDNRRQEIPLMLKSLDADVICLQEVWYSDDMERILDHFAGTMHSYSALHDADSSLEPVSAFHSPCLNIGFARFIACWEWSCPKGGDEKTMLDCAVQRCGLLALPQECITCLILSGQEEMVSSCVGTVGRKFNVPGLLLLSKSPLRNVQLVPYLQNSGKLLIPRFHISAEVEGIGQLECTHMTTDLGGVYFEQTDEYKSWSEQSLAEARALIHWLQHSPRAVVMGDLNSSPSIPENYVMPELQDSLDYLTSQGLSSTFMDSVAICSYCSYNPLVPGQQSWMYDHILLRNHTVVLTRRIADEEVSDGLPLSDHYGIEVVISLEP